MRIVKISGFTTVILFSLMACNSGTFKHKVSIETAEDCQVQMKDAALQLEGLSELSLIENRIPRTINEDGEMHWTSENFDWTEGFFPGSMWLLYGYTNEEKWKKAAVELQENYANHRYLKSSHDLGFVFNCSYGNASRITKEE